MKQTDNTIREEKAQALLAAYKNGDDSAFLAIYDMYANMLFNYGSCITSDEELVKDCIQDVFLKIVNKKADLQLSKVGSYLFISLRNRLLDEFRHLSSTTDTPVEELRRVRAVAGVEEEYIAQEREALNSLKVASLMQELTPRQRQAFTLYYLEQRKYDEICEIMQMNYHSIRNLVHRGMLRMRAAAV